jgi:hypothetical protein
MTSGQARALWKAGAAATVITPEEPLWLAGWAVRTSPARGTASDLYARALALEDPEGSRFVLLTVDLIAVTRAIAGAVARQVHERFGLERDRLLVCASHTHCGPEIRPDKVPFFGIPPEFAARIPAYVDELTDRLGRVVAAAIYGLQPGQLSVGRTLATFARNRRGAAEVVDHDVPLLEVTGVDGRRRAVVFGYACHNLAMPPGDGRYCGDYSGFAQAALEADGEAPVCLFVAGAGADQDPEPRGTLKRARRHGRELAEAVVRGLAGRDSLRPVTGRLGVAFEEVPLDFQPLAPRAELEADLASTDRPTRTKAAFLLERLDRGEPLPASYPCPVQVVALGDALRLIALGGEPDADYALEYKRRHEEGGRMVWVAGYANDMFGYVPTARLLREGGYEGSRSLLWSALPAPFAEDSEERIHRAVDRLVARLEPE